MPQECTTTRKLYKCVWLGFKYVGISIDEKHKCLRLLELILPDQSPITHNSFCLLPVFPSSLRDLRQKRKYFLNTYSTYYLNQD